MAVSTAKTLHPGYSFRPSDQELLVHFLRPRISGHPPAADFIHDADVYSAGPAALTDGYTPAPASNGEKVWYFFCSLRAKNPRDRRPSRTVGSGEGRWHPEKSADPVLDEDGHRVGHRRNLSFKNKNGDRLGWLMVEFGVDQEEDASPVMVICKVYRSPRAPRAETSAATSAALSGSKRKAADEHPEVGTRVRRRHSPSPEAAALQTERTAEEDTRGILRILEEAVMADEPDMPQGAKIGDFWTEGDMTEYSSMLELLLVDELDQPQDAETGGSSTEGDAAGFSCILERLEEMLMADEGSIAAESPPLASDECSIPVSAVEPDPSLPWSPSWAPASCGDDDFSMFMPSLLCFDSQF